MADETTPASGTPDETTPIEPVVVADQGPVDQAPVDQAPPSGRVNPWLQWGLIGAAVLGLMALSGVAGFAIGQGSDRGSVMNDFMAQRGPDADDGRTPWGDGYGQGDRFDMDDHMEDHLDGYGRGPMPGMGELPSPEQMLQWLEERGIDMDQFMQEFGPGGMGPGGMGPDGMRPGMGQGTTFAS